MIDQVIGSAVATLIVVFIIGYIFQVVSVLINLVAGEYNSKIRFLLSFIPAFPIFVAFWRIGK